MHFKQMKLASGLYSSYRSFEKIWNKSPPDNFNIIRVKSLVMTCGSILIFLKADKVNLWLSSESAHQVCCVLQQGDQQEIKD